MRKLSIMLAFMFVGSFVFASAYYFNHAITVYTSCGETGVIIVQEGDSTEDIMEMAQEMEDWLCG